MILPVRSEPEPLRALPSLRPECLQPIVSTIRHTHATMLLSEGVNPKVVAERLGHSTIVLTLDTYSHVLPDMQKQAADCIESLLFRRVGTL